MVYNEIDYSGMTSFFIRDDIPKKSPAMSHRASFIMKSLLSVQDDFLEIC